MKYERKNKFLNVWIMVKQTDWDILIHLRINSRWEPCGIFEPHDLVDIKAKHYKWNVYKLTVPIIKNNYNAKNSKNSMRSYLVWRDENI